MRQTEFQPMRASPFTAICVAVCVALPALAQVVPARTGRLAYTEGAVSIQQDPDAGWDPAQVNRPLAPGNSVLTEVDARAEVRVSSASIRLGEGTQLALTRIDEDSMEAMVAVGSVVVRLRQKPRAERYTFATPEAVFVIDAEGTYRIDYDPSQDESRLTVSSGAAHMVGPTGNVAVAAGNSVRLTGGDDPSYAIDEPVEEDALDRWSLSRDAGWSDTTSRRYVSPYMTGSEDLDANGQWSADPDYGALWTPSNVAPTWSPYSDGQWASVQPWGWTWIDNAPWGYAPFHYGRWLYVRNRWSWCPGPRVARPVYAPALVAWTGGTAGPSASGWYPLAPWDRYQPWYRANASHVDRVNATVRDRPPRDWKGPPDGWRRWNRDHATTNNSNGSSFAPHAGSPVVARPPHNAEKPKPVREATPSSKPPRPPRESHPPAPRPPQAQQPVQAPRPPQAQQPVQAPPQRPAAPAPHAAEKEKER